MVIDKNLEDEIKDLRRRVMKIESIESIHSVFSEYSLKMDLGLWGEVSALFTKNAILEIVGYENYGGVDYDGIILGRDNIAKFYDESTPDTLPKNKHNIIPKPIKFDHSGNFLTAYLVAYLVGADNQIGGLYEAALKRSKTCAWRFLKLRCVNTYKKSVSESVIGHDTFFQNLESSDIKS
ncbi:MAG: nuclear transport factor 2 family protein [Porticoccaceae bacterium]